MVKIAVDKVAVLPYRFSDAGLELLLSPGGLTSSFAIGNPVGHGPQCKAAAMLAIAAFGIRGRIHKRWVRGKLEPHLEDIYIYLLECRDQQDPPSRYSWIPFHVAEYLYAPIHRRMFDEIYKRIQAVNKLKFR